MNDPRLTVSGEGCEENRLAPQAEDTPGKPASCHRATTPRGRRARQALRRRAGDAEARAAARRRRLRRVTVGRWGRALAVVFIAWHLFALVVWLVATDTPSALGGLLLPIVRPYMTLTGFKQSWHLFGPKPSRLDVYLEARITYADGHTASWVFPRLARLGYVERIRQERFRQLTSLAVPDAGRAAWPSVARYAARQNAPDPRDPPVTVALVRHFRSTPPPGAPWEPFREVTFYRTALTAADLR